MSTWMSLVGGMVKEYPGIHELEVRSSNGTSSTTGPGRPVTMVFQACRTIIGTCSPRVGWYTRLHTLRTVEGKSAWCWRYNSWNAPRPNWLVGTLPVTARNGTESRNALPSEIGRFAEPGPQEVKVAVGRPETRHN